MIGIYVESMGWIRSHEDTCDGRGHTVFTFDPSLALGFPSKIDALEYWRQQSKTVPLRPDGRPNRPITAFSAEILPLTEKPLMP